MPLRIDGKQVRERRSELGLTLDGLAAKSGVDKTTIHLIETGKRRRGVRKGTQEKLAAALGIEAMGAADDRGEARGGANPPPMGDLVQMNVRVAPGARNAWSLLALRYGVPITRLAEMAPLAFFLVAEGSLHHRRRRLEELEDRARQLGELRESFPDWPPGVLAPEPALEDAVGAEQASIEARDLFGGKVLASRAFDPFDMPEEWDPNGGNAFAAYVREQLRALAPEAALRDLGDARAPAYRVCGEDVRRLVGDDWEAADAVGEGHALLHEMPKDLLKDGPPERRATWAKERAAAWRKEFLGDLLDLDLGPEGERA